MKSSAEFSICPKKPSEITWSGHLLFCLGDQSGFIWHLKLSKSEVKSILEINSRYLLWLTLVHSKPDLYLIINSSCAKRNQFLVPMINILDKPLRRASKVRTLMTFSSNAFIKQFHLILGSKNKACQVLLYYLAKLVVPAIILKVCVSNNPIPSAEV